MADERPAAPQPLPRRETWVDLGAEYPGFAFRLWVNYPAGWDELLFHNDPEQNKADELLPKIVLEHNGWLDFDGNPISQPTDPDFWKCIPGELIALILVVIQKEKVKLPLSRMPQRRK